MPATLPPRSATATSVALPPRPSTATPVAIPSSVSAQPVGGYIELSVHPAQADLWTMVQWQDGLGRWHDVEGWQGTLDEGGQKIWWVAQPELGRGPFRWVILTREREQLDFSQPFYLPKAGQIVRVQVSLLTP